MHNETMKGIWSLKELQNKANDGWNIGSRKIDMWCVISYAKVLETSKSKGQEANVTKRQLETQAFT